jgi:hypothetical protein
MQERVQGFEAHPRGLMAINVRGCPGVRSRSEDRVELMLDFPREGAPGYRMVSILSRAETPGLHRGKAWLLGPAQEFVVKNLCPAIEKELIVFRIVDGLFVVGTREGLDGVPGLP